MRLDLNRFWIAEKPDFEDIVLQTGTTEGYPVYTTITASDQRNWVNKGYGSVTDLINIELSAASMED